MDKKILINGVFYLVLTSFFLILWIKEKQIAVVIKEYRSIFSTKIINKFGVKNKKTQEGIRKTVDFTETIGSAIVLVLIIQRFYLGNFLVPTGSMIPTIMEKDRLFGNMVVYKFSTPKREDIVVFKEPVQNKVLYTKRLMGLPGEKLQVKADDRLYIDGVKYEKREYTQIGDMGSRVWTVPKKGDILEITTNMNIKEELLKRNFNVKEVQEQMYENPGVIKSSFPGIKFSINGKETGPLPDLLHDRKMIEKLINGEEIRMELKSDYYLVLGDNTRASSDSRVWGFVEESRFRGKPFFRFWPLNKMGILK